MSLIMLVLILLLLFGGGGFAFRGTTGGLSGVGLILIVLVALYLMGYLR